MFISRILFKWPCLYLNVPSHKGPALTVPVPGSPMCQHSYSKNSGWLWHCWAAGVQEGGRWGLCLGSGSCGTFINSSLVFMTLGRPGGHSIYAPGVKPNQKQFPVFTKSVKFSCHCEWEGKKIFTFIFLRGITPLSPGQLLCIYCPVTESQRAPLDLRALRKLH